MQKLNLKKLVICLATTLPMMANAYEPSVTALGMGGVYTSGWMDGLIPVYQNNQQLVYSDLQFEGNSTNAGILSAGGGYRQQVNSQGIAGAYLFYDRERSASENYYNVISPGVEYLTPSWQYRLNYYAPFGNKSYLVSQGLAEDFGNIQYESFSGNTKTDSMQYNYESLSYGADFTLGYRFQADKRWQVNVSPYVFNQTDENTMMGANAQLNFYTNDHTTVFLGDGYDNVNHNRVFIGVSLTFGGHNNDDSVDNLMQSPVYRNLDVNTTSNGLPINDYTEFSAPEQQPGFYSFVNDAATGSDNLGTYEDPYTSIDDISGAPDDAQIRVASTGTNYSGDSITLTGTQTIAGYTDDYKLLATGNDRPIIETDGLILNGNNVVTGLQLLGSGEANSVGIQITDTATLNDVLVGSTTASNSYVIGVELTDGASATITDSTISGYVPDGGTNLESFGVKADANNTVSIDNSTINAVSVSNNTSAYAHAVDLINGSTGTISNSTLTGTAIAGRAYGLQLMAGGDVTVTHSTMTGIASNGYARGFQMENSAGDVNISDSSMVATGYNEARAVTSYQSSGDLTITNSTMTATATSTSTSTGYAYGIFSNGSAGNVTVSNSVIDVQSSKAEDGSQPGAIGLFVVGTNTGAVTLTDSEMTVVEDGGARGAGVFNVSNTGSGVVTVTDNTIDVTATTPLGISGTVTQSGNTVNLYTS